MKDQKGMKGVQPLKPAIPQKKSVLKQVMGPKDWVMLAVLVVFFVICWTWVWQSYSQPFDYNLIMENTLNRAI